ncbi:MAG TPA: hypothetical protein VGI54_06765 [Solirubrobacteraceae bacterium]
MATALADPLFDLDRPPGDGGEGDGPTLEQLVSGAWEGLLAHAAVACPVCGGGMRPRYSSAAAPIGGRCHDCGSELA